MEFAALAAKALQIKLTQRSLGTKKANKAATAALQASSNDVGLVVISKLFLDKSNPVNEAVKINQELYQYHTKHTLPYVDGGTRLLPNARYLDYSTGIAQFRAKLQSWASQHMPNYDKYIQQDIYWRTGKGQGASVDEYPSAGRLLAFLDPVVVVEPLPQSSHFLYDISETDRQNFEAIQAERFATAQTDAIARALRPVQKLIEKLDSYSGGPKERFHESLVTNVMEGALSAKSLTLDAPEDYIAQLDSLVDKVNNLSVDGLRENVHYREDTKQDMAKILSQLEFFAPKV